ncbi:MAG TPA: hypothetical protein ENI73_09650, partial [Spirochaetes bacterium]|nr:hypothetical protein [Spirochaetota bacterium]
MKKKLDVLDDVFFTIWLFGWVVTPVFLIAMIFVSSDVMDAYGVYIFTVFWVGVGGLVTSHLALKVTSYIRDTSDDYDSKRTISSVAHEYDVKANQAGLDHSYVDERQKEKEKAEKEKAEKAEKEKQRMREKMLKTKWGRVPISGNKLKNALSILQSRSESINDMWWTILMESGHPILEEV